MRLSTKGRYGVTAMMDLAIHDNAGPVTLADISQCQGISLSYLEQLFSKLRKHGLVDGVRGPGGGYKLARSADSITVAEIITAVDEKVDITNCGGTGDCLNGQRCLTHELWSELSTRLFDFLNDITLSQFVSRPGIRELAMERDEINGRFALAKRQATALKLEARETGV